MKYLLKDLAPGKTYYLQFRSKDADGNVSEWSRTFSLSTTGDIYAPNTPTGLTVTSVGRSFQAAWTGPTTSTDGSPATDLRHYLVKVESSLAPGVTKTYTTPDTKFELTFEKNLETFTTARGTIGISVAAQDMTGNVSTYTSVVTASNPAPAAVTGLTATAGVEKIALSWNPNTEDDLKHYEVWRSKTGAAGTYTKQWTGSSTQYTDPSIDYFTDHWYRVYAVDVFNTLSTAAQTGSALRPVGSFAMDSTAPATPTSLAATLTNATDGKTAKAVVTWTATPDTDGDLAEYIIDYKPSAETNWDTTKVDYEKTAVTIVGLLPYTNYDFRIRSSDWSANLSGWSATVTKTATANTAPATVTGVTVTPGRDSITVAWTANTEPDVMNGAGTYNVDIATDSGFTAGLLSYKTGATNITVSGLAQNQIYYARVKAVDSLGLASAAWSTSANGTTGTYPVTSLSDGSVPTGAPTLTATGGIGYIFLSWGVLANADPVTYEVFMSTTNGFTTYDATTKIGEIGGTSMFIENTVAGTPLVYGTTYYFKVRARDRDGVSATVSAQASATPVKVGSTDSTLTAADVGAPTVAQYNAVVTDISNVSTATDTADALNTNPGFSKWTNAGSTPDNWNAWSTIPTRETTLVRTPPYAARFNCTDTATQRGLQQAVAGVPIPFGTEYITLTLEVMMNSGTSFGGAGVLLDWTGMTGGNRSQLDLAAEIPTPQTGKWYRVTKILRRPTSAVGTQTNWNLFLMGQYSGFGSSAVKDIIYNRCAVRPASAEEIKAYGAATEGWVVSRNGTDLVSNGTALMGDKTNFSLFTSLDKSDNPGAGGGAFVSTIQATLFNDEFIPVDTTRKYRLSMFARQGGGAVTSYTYSGLAPFDIDKLSISPSYYMYQNNTTTTLATTLIPGATTVTLTSAANWNNAAGASTHLRSFIFWNYVDGQGKAWGQQTYSRNYYGDMWADGGISGNVITLRAPWAGPTIAAGTPVSNGSAGGNYMYGGLVNTILPQTWTQYSQQYGLVMPNGTSQTSMGNATTMFPPGTAFIKLMWLVNRSTALGGSYPAGSISKFANISFSDATAAQATADLAMTAANGKNTIVHSTSAASGTSYIDGDTWFQYTGTAPNQTVIAQWRFASGAWVAEKIDSLVIANLDAAKITAGSTFTQNLGVKSTFTLGDAGTPGIIQSYDYATGTAGFRFSSSGLEIVNGIIDAKAIKTNSSFVTNLYIGTGGAIQSTGYTGGGTSGFQLSATGLTIKGTNNVVAVEAVAAGTISAKTINIGTGGVLNVDATGVIKSNNYSGTTTGYQLSNTGLIINDGDIDAKNLRTNTAIIGDLTIGRSADALGTIKSFDYSPGNTGWKIGKGLFEVNNGLIKAAALQLQTGHNMMPIEYADFEYGDNYYLNPFWNARGQGKIYENNLIAAATTSNKVFGKQSLNIYTFSPTAGSIRLAKTSTDYNIPVDANGKYYISAYLCNYASTAESWTINVIGNNGATIATQAFSHGASESAFTRRGLAVNVPASGVSAVLVEIQATSATFNKGLLVDGVQFEPVTAGLTQASVWKPPAQTYIDASGVTTGYLRSLANINVAGTDLPAWSLNKDGNMQVGDALIRGKLVVGTTSETPVNLAPGNGDFETNVTGYSVFHLGATGTAIARTTTAGEVIDGTGSAKVTAAAGNKTRLGIQWNGPTDVAAGKVVRVTAQVKVDATTAGSSIRVAFWNPSVVAYEIVDVIMDPVAGQIYDISYTHEVPAGETLRTFTIYHHHATAITTTSFIADNITLIDNTNIGVSYVSSPDYSAGASGWRIFGDGSVEFNNGVFRGSLGAGMVDADALVSELVISSDFKTARTGRRVEFGSKGVSLYDVDESLLVNLPTDTTSPAMFNGDLLATSITISDQMAIRGENNELSKGANITISSGTTEPTSPPTVQIGYEQINVGTDTVYAPYRYSLAYSPVHNRFIQAQSVYGGNVSLSFYNPATGAQDYFTTGLKDIRDWGNVMVWGGEIYILGKKIDGKWAVEVRNETTKAWVRTWNITNQYNYRAAIGNDGTNVFVLFGANSDHRIAVTKFNKTTGAIVGSTLLSDHYMTGGNYHLSGAGYLPAGTSGGFSTSRYWWSRDNQKTIWVADSALQSINATTSGESFTSPNNTRGTVFADVNSTGNAFYTWDYASGIVTKHTGVSWLGTSTNSSRWHVATSWYDPDATGGTHETKVGKIVSFTMIKRAALTITAPPIPVRPLPNTTDDVRQAGIYMARNASVPATTLLERQGYTANESRVLYLHRNGGPNSSMPVAGGAPTNPPKTTNEFDSIAGVAPGKIRSNDDRIVIRGDGTGNFGDMTLQAGGFSGGLYVTHTARQYTVSLATGFGIYGSPYGAGLRFFRTADGAWIGSGLVERTGANVSVGTSGVLIGTIPSWNGTISQIGPSISTSNASKTFTFLVNSSGQLYLRTHATAVTVATNDWFSLAGTVFHAAAN